MIKLKLPVLILSIGLITTSASANIDYDNIDFSIQLNLGTVSYDNSAADKATKTLVKAMPGSQSFTFGGGAQLKYHTNKLSFLLDAKYHKGEIVVDTDDGQFNTNSNAALSAGKVSHNSLKTKALVGMNLSSWENVKLIPAAGISYWSDTYYKDQVVTPKRDKLDLSTTLVTLPIGFNLSYQGKDKLGLHVDAYYHIVLKGTSKTLRGYKSDGTTVSFEALPKNYQIYEYKHPKGLNTSYAFQLSTSLVQDMRSEDYGLDYIGLGVYYDHLKLAKSAKKNLTIGSEAAADYHYGPAKDYHYGVYLTIGI